MELSMDLLELRIRDVRIDLSGRDRGVSEELLDRSDIGTIGEESRREAMSECMSGNFFDDIRSECVLLDLVCYEESAETHVYIRKWLFYDIISLY